MGNTDEPCCKLWTNPSLDMLSKPLYGPTQDNTWSSESSYPITISRSKETPGRSRKSLISSTFHLVLRTAVVLGPILAILASGLLLLIGILMDHRACLTAGCVLGLASFGVVLHGCLNHRTLPNSTSPLVLSAACMYPVGAIPFSGGSDAATAAMATASLLPRSFKPAPTTLMTSTLDVSNMVKQFHRERPNHRFSSISSPRAARKSHHRSSGYREVQTMPYVRHVSDSAACCPRRHAHFSPFHGFHQPVDPSIDFLTQNSCPARTSNITSARSEEDEHLYANSPVIHDRQVALSRSHSEEDDLTMLTRLPLMGSSENRINQSCQYKPDRMAPFNASSNTPLANRPINLRLNSNQWEDARSIDQSQSSLYSTTLEANRNTPMSAPPVRGSFVSPEPHPLGLPHCFLYPPESTSVQESISQDLLRCLSQGESQGYASHFGRRYHNSRERDGLFGPRVWRGWHSWVDS